MPKIDLAGQPFIGPVKLVMQKLLRCLQRNSTAFKIDFTAKDKTGKTGIQLAEKSGNADIVNLIKRKNEKELENKERKKNQKHQKKKRFENCILRLKFK